MLHMFCFAFQPAQFALPVFRLNGASPILCQHSRGLPARLQRATKRGLLVTMVKRDPGTGRVTKRLVVLADGTWQTPENAIPTNILKLSMAVKLESSDGVQQVVCYGAGVGSKGGIDRILGGYFGVGIDQHIKDLYTFLLMNYDDGDEVFMFGFSRGAYTVRSLAGLIHCCGLGRRDQLQFVDEAYELYRASTSAQDTPEAQLFRKNHGDRIPITLLACFDTVGDLGLPGMFHEFDKHRYAFHNTSISAEIQNAIHIMSIDETRLTYKPTVMSPSSPENSSQLTQLYLPGTHSGVGGGSPDEEQLSDSALRFLVEEMNHRQLGLELNMGLIPTGSRDVPPVPVEFGVDRVFGKYIRPIKSLNECHQPYVKERYQLQKTWRPEALAAFDQDLSAVDVSL